MKCSGNYVLEITLWNFQQFFTKLGTVEAKSLQLTKQMLEKRQQLEMVIQGLQQKINTGLSKINELQQEEAILEKHELDILANKDFSYEAKIQQDEKCLEYNFTCHYPCSYPLGEDKYHCTAVVNQGDPHKAKYFIVFFTLVRQ